MNRQIQETLLALNRDFYESVAPHFDATRRGWTPGLRAILPHLRAFGKEKLALLDVGCGNGRFARLLAHEGIAASYTGVDGNQALLQLGREGARNLVGVDCHFTRADLADPFWSDTLTGQREPGSGSLTIAEPPQYDFVLCLATMQHLPGYALRLRLLNDLCRLSAGPVILSFWQFLSSERFRAKLIEPEEAGVVSSELEPGDAFLPWRQGVEAVRYVHQVDRPELSQLAADAGMSVVRTFCADGKETNLNLYAVLAHTR